MKNLFGVLFAGAVCVGLLSLILVEKGGVAPEALLELDTWKALIAANSGT